jgi:hypothetical protein
MELTGLDIGDGGCNAVKIVGSHYVPGGLNHYIDDFYICDDTGDFNNDFLGDVRVDAYFPTADGTYQDFAKSTGAASWSLLDENPPNAADYVRSSTVGHKNTIKVTAAEKVDGLGNVLPIKGVVVSNFANNPEGGGVRKVKPICKSGVTEVQGEEVALTNLYNRTPQVLEVDPDTGLAWDVTTINAAEFGVEVAE